MRSGTPGACPSCATEVVTAEPNARARAVAAARPVACAAAAACDAVAAELRVSREARDSRVPGHAGGGHGADTRGGLGDGGRRAGEGLALGEQRAGSIAADAALVTSSGSARRRPPRSPTGKPPGSRQQPWRSEQVEAGPRCCLPGPWSGSGGSRRRGRARHGRDVGRQSAGRPCRLAASRVPRAAVPVRAMSVNVPATRPTAVRWARFGWPRWSTPSRRGGGLRRDRAGLSGGPLSGKSAGAGQSRCDQSRQLTPASSMSDGRPRCCRGPC